MFIMFPRPFWNVTAELLQDHHEKSHRKGYEIVPFINQKLKMTRTF